MTEAPFTELYSKREELKAAMDVIEETITKTQIGAIAICNSILSLSKGIIERAEKSDHEYLFNEAPKVVNHLKREVCALERVLFNQDLRGIDDNPTQGQPIKNRVFLTPSAKEWWLPFLDFRTYQQYEPATIADLTGYPIDQIKRALQRRRVKCFKTATNVWAYEGADLVHIAKLVSAGNTVKAELLKVDKGKVYTISDVVMMTGMSYAKVLKKFGDLKSVKNCVGVSGFSGQDLYDFAEKMRS